MLTIMRYHGERVEALTLKGLVDFVKLPGAGSKITVAVKRARILARPRRHRQVVEEPVVERTMVRELQRAKRVCDMLQCVGLAMCEIIGRVDAPLRAGSRVRRMQDAVQHGVAQVHVG